MKTSKERILHAYLAKECGINKFKVIDKKDILASFEKGVYVDENELESLMISLERQGIIKIKYDDDSVFCLSVLQDIAEKRKESPKRTLFPLLLTALLGGFLGSILGEIFISLIF